MKIGIVSGVISSLIVIIFIQPILNFTWDAVIGIAGSIQQGYVDIIYRSAAIGDRNLVGHLALMVLVLFLMGSSIALLLRASPIPTYLLVLSPSILTIVGVAGLIVTLMFLVSFTLSSGIMEIAASFSQRLTVLAPAITDSEYKNLKARWASMRTEADYKKIVADMEKRANELSIALPPLRKP